MTAGVEAMTSSEVAAVAESEFDATLISVPKGAATQTEDYQLALIGGGEKRDAPLTEVKALMYAVLEDAIRCYLSPAQRLREEAEHWMESGQRRWVFSFIVICETLGLDPTAARRALRQMRHKQTPADELKCRRRRVRHYPVSLAGRRVKA